MTACFGLQSSGIPDLSGSGAHSYKHYRLGKDIVLRLEYISPKDTKVRVVHSPWAIMALLVRASPWTSMAFTDENQGFRC